MVSLELALGVLGYLLPWEAQREGASRPALGVSVRSPALRSQQSAALNPTTKPLPLTFSCSVGWTRFAKESLARLHNSLLWKEWLGYVLRRGRLHYGMPLMFLKAIFKINSIL